MPGRSFEVAIDANDPARLRPFWITALRYIQQTTPEVAVDLVDPEGRGPTIWFQQVPETKTAKNRLHLDIKVPRSQRDALAEELIALGGTVVRTFPGFTVVADPEGNELCLTDEVLPP
jgi:4a-hydroxytetrahydrobiopterin dehydratase